MSADEIQPTADETADHSMDVEYHLNQIERHTAAIRGEDPPDVSPADFRLPTGTELRHLRETCGLTIEEAAGVLEYSENWLYQIENGNEAPGRELLRRCLILYRREWPRHRGEP